MKYLVFSDLAEAKARSSAAYAPLRPAGAGTAYLWSWQEHPADGRVALLIPETAAEAQIAIDQPSYDALFTGAEWAGMADELGADWTAQAE